MRTPHIKKTVAMSGAMFIALMGATGSADALAPHQGNGNHVKAEKADKAEKTGKTDHGQSQGNRGKSHATHGHQASNGGHSGSQGGASHGSSGTTHGSSGTHGSQGGAKGGDPAGNNGTVKIAPLGDFDGIPNNTPHVGCDFIVEWYGFDEGDDIISTVTFAMQAPTKDVVLGGYTPTQVFVGEDPASGAGTETGLDARQEYHLTFDGAPHPKQGYHVKLTINTPGSIGADVKHKVFWVQGCESTTPETPETPGTPGTPEVPGTPGTPDTPEVLGEQAHVPHQQGATQTEVKGEQAAAPKAAQVVPTVVDSGLAPLATAFDTATDEWPLAVGALGLCLLGIGLLTRRARS